METLITNAELIEAGRALELKALAVKIPYVPGGMSLSGMDCQGLPEYLLMQCGIPASECNLSGSNAHWRQSLKWRGTPEEATEKFGCVPGGAVPFIVDYEGGGEKARGYYDDLGDANHMGLYLGDCVLHASSSRGCVAQSTFEGKTIPNGGWNAVGLLRWVDYGTQWEQEGAPGALDGIGSGNGESDGESVGGEQALTAGTPAASQSIYATVVTPDGNPVKLRKTASAAEKVYWKVNCGATVRVERKKGDWALVTAICTDGHQRRAYMMGRFLKDEG